MSGEKGGGYVDAPVSYEADVPTKTSKYEPTSYESHGYEADPGVKGPEHESDDRRSEAEKRRAEVLKYTKDRTERDREKIDKKAEGLSGLFDKFRRNSSARMVTGIALAVVSNGIPGAGLPFQIARTALAAVGGGTSGEGMYLNKTESSFLNKFTTKDPDGKVNVNETALSKLTPDELAELLGGLSQIASLKGLKVDLEALKADEAMVAKIKESESKNAVMKNVEAMREWFAKMPWYMKIGLPLAAASLGFAGGAFAIAGTAVSFGLGFLGTKRMYAQTAYEHTGMLKSVEEEILKRAEKGEITAEQLRLAMDKSSEKVESGRKKWLIGGAAIGGGVSALLYGASKSGLFNQADKHDPSFTSGKNGEQPVLTSGAHSNDASEDHISHLATDSDDKNDLVPGAGHAPTTNHTVFGPYRQEPTTEITHTHNEGDPILHLKNQEHLYHEGPGAAHNLAKEVLKATDSKLSHEQFEKAQDHLAADWERRGLFKPDGSLAVPVKNLIHEINGPAEGHEAALMARAQVPEVHHVATAANHPETHRLDVQADEAEETDYDTNGNLKKISTESLAPEAGISTPTIVDGHSTVIQNDINLDAPKIDNENTMTAQSNTVPEVPNSDVENKFESGDNGDYDDVDDRTVEGGIGTPTSTHETPEPAAPAVPAAHVEAPVIHHEAAPDMAFLSQLNANERDAAVHLYQIAERGDVDKLRHLSEHIHEHGFWRSIPRETEWKWLLPDPKTAPDVMPIKEGEVSGEWIGHRPGFIFRGKLNWEPRIEHDHNFLNHIAKANEAVLAKFDHVNVPDEVPAPKDIHSAPWAKESGPDSYETPESSKPTPAEIAEAAQKPEVDDSVLDGGRSTPRHEEIAPKPIAAEEHIGKPSAPSGTERKQIDDAIAAENKINEINTNVDFFRTTPEQIDKMKETVFTPDMSDPVSKITEPVFHGIKMPRIEDSMIDMWKHDGNTSRIVELQKSIGANLVPSQAEWPMLWPKEATMPKEMPTEVGSKVGEWISIQNLQKKFVWEPRIEYDASYRGAIVDRAWHIIMTNLK